MEETTIQESTIFPVEYGDFALHCSDDVVCHFPRHLLGYMSGFFKDMFCLPDVSVNDIPLRVTEASRTIELLLQHIDPKTKTPDIDPRTIIELLEAARKYQVSPITEWFEREIKLKRTTVWAEDPLSQSTRSLEPLLVMDPLLVLYCAVRFELPRSGQLALREFTQCDANLLRSMERDFPLHVYLHAMDLRNKRIEFFKAFVTELAALQTHSPTQGHRDSWPPRGRGTPATVGLGLAKRGAAGVKDNERKTCVTCTATRASWILRIERAIRQEPSWSSFTATYEKNATKCSQCESSSWADYHRSVLSTWELRAAKIQRELPAWPY